MIGPEPQYLDEFTSLLVPDDTRVMVDLLKLAVSCRSGEKGRDVLSAVLSGMGTAYPQVIHSILHVFFFLIHRPHVRSCSKTDNLLSLAPGPTQSVCGPVQPGLGLPIYGHANRTSSSVEHKLFASCYCTVKISVSTHIATDFISSPTLPGSPDRRFWLCSLDLF